MAIPQQTQPIAFRIKAPPELDAAVREQLRRCSAVLIFQGDG